MSLFGSKPSTPTSPSAPRPDPAVKPSFSPISQFSNPKPATPTTPKAVPKPGILGEHGFKSFLQMRGFARKQSYAPVPTYGTKLSKEKRVEIVKTLQQYSGQTYGLSTTKYHEALKKMQKDKYMAGVHHDYKKAKELDQKIKQLSAWEKMKK